MASAEILAVLADEVVEVSDAIDSTLVRAAAAADAEQFREALTEYVAQFERIAAVCDALGLDGLRQVCAFVETNLAALAIGTLVPERVLLFGRWPQLVLGYLQAPRDGVYSRELTELFRRGDWPQPLDATAASALEQTLLALDHNDTTVARPARQSIALPQDTALEIPEDINRKLVDAFLSEGPQQASEYSALIQGIVRGEGWTDELQECRRLVHALKGAANTVGVRGVATLCHHVEDIIEYLFESAVRPEGELGRLLVKVADTLETMFEALLGNGTAPADALSVLQRVLDWVNLIDRGEYHAAASALPAPVPDDTGATASRPAVKPAAEVESKLRIAARTVDSLLRNSGEIAIAGGHVRERLQQAFKVLHELRERHTTLWDRTSDMESFVATQGIAAGRRQSVALAGTADGFDPLELDQYSELHTYVHSLSETVADLQMLGTRLVETLTAAEVTATQQVALNNEQHELLLTSRMLAAGNLEARLQRTVRQAADQCGKQVALCVEGKDVMLDDQMVNVLIDPLQHLLRNAVDHGIEAPARRAVLGKPETGTLTLSFRRDGNYVVVVCRDDGAGLDLERIRARALEQGLIDAADDLDDAAIARLVLRPGFSTAASLTEVSGRGVGMDIVHTGIARLKGSIDIRTEAGRGATIALRAPMSLGIVHCLLVASGQQIFALPSDNLERIVYAGAAHLRRDNGRWTYRDDELECPAQTLAQLIGEGAESMAQDRQRHVVLMKDIGGNTAIVVDAVIGGQDLVIKKLGRFLANVTGVIGASILGDGTVVPILELADLLRIERGEIPERTAAAHADATMADVLVVDDSLSTRTALSTLLAEEGFRVRTAKDGVEAIEAIAEARPAVVLADMEMPRMNGLELTAHLRASLATRTLPVIMITSRTADKHRKLARAAGVDDYVTKPYRDHDLLVRVRTILNQAA
jgi:chemotaxis protein histidine kinase CheA/CheY-like chemotaxis protein